MNFLSNQQFFFSSSSLCVCVFTYLRAAAAAATAYSVYLHLGYKARVYTSHARERKVNKRRGLLKRNSLSLSLESGKSYTGLKSAATAAENFLRAVCIREKKVRAICIYYPLKSNARLCKGRAAVSRIFERKKHFVARERCMSIDIAMVTELSGEDYYTLCLLEFRARVSCRGKTSEFLTRRSSIFHSLFSKIEKLWKNFEI